ncbi:hypothetical protein SAMIE_1024590 [Sphingobium amiense]|uniref:Uncharacterized protein n=1 Tax=Sphingobium amiense TaxID=135719 RepID=A0A494W6Y8_9SPHN|nr:hypothetical protein [Sphingobium amiense]BBD98958.1 hypothetical protein SAMIE_1024590 [Sphingobium amiense]
MELARVIIGLAAVSVPSVAQAGWQYTQWGMSSAEVAGASGGKTQPLVFDPNSVDPMLRDHLPEIAADAPTMHAPYQTGGRQFDVEFHFSNDRLDRATLHLKAPLDCFKLAGEMAAAYGIPDKHYERSNTSWWRDKEKGNHVMFSAWANEQCTITYQPLSNKSDSGL